MQNRGIAIAVAVVVGVIVLVLIIDQATSPDGEKVLVFGDSITFLGNNQLNSTLGSDFKLTVNGQSGAKVAEREVPAKFLAGGTPEQVIINLGTNDVLQHVPADQSAAGLQQMVSDFSKASCIHLVTINTHLKPPDTQYRAGAVALNDAIAKLADSNDAVDVIDWDALNSDAIDKEHPNGLTFDGVHPNAEGEKELESAYSDALDKCGRPWHFW